MTDQSTLKPASEQDAATEEETQAERELRQKRQKRAKFRRAVRTALLVLLIIAAICAAGVIVHTLVFGPPAGNIPLSVPASSSEQASEPVRTSETAQAAQSAQTQKTPSAQSADTAAQSAESPAAGGGEEQTGSQSASLEGADGSGAVQSAAQSDSAAGSARTQEPEQAAGGYAAETGATQKLGSGLFSGSAILIDAASNTVIAEKDADQKIYPASMTKILTALVASEHIEDWDATFTMTQEIIDPLFKEGASLAGFSAGETVTMRDLLYGALLPSGAEATTALAICAAGSEEAFVELMNEKAQELGLTTAHFMNNSGLHDENHYCTVRDMAVILRAAMENPACRAALTSESYTAAATEQNPEGLKLYDKFLYRISKQSRRGAHIFGAKTGYTSEAANCCASFGLCPDGREVICVTAKAPTSWNTISDHIKLYTVYAVRTPEARAAAEHAAEK